MGVTGNLRTMLPGDLLQWLSLGQKTGTLVVTSKAVEKKIFFKTGRVISSASNDPREYLGQFLMSHGFISEAELKKAMEVQEQSGILLGKILVMIEAIKEEDLTRLMRLKAEEEIYDVFLWKEGEFRFIDNELPRMEMIPLQVDVTGIIMEGTRRVDEWMVIREIIPNDRVIPFIEVPIEPEAPLNDAARKIVHAVNGRRSIADIVLETRSSSFNVSSTLYSLIREGYVHIVDEKEQSTTGKMEAPIIAAAQKPDFNEDDEINSLLIAAQTALRSRDFEKAQRLLKAAQNLDPNHQRVRAASKGAETVIVNDLRAQGLANNKIPKVIMPIEEITKMNFSPNEGFMLSRINGQWDIGSLIKISPIREPDAMLIFYKLWKDKIISVD